MRSAVTVSLVEEARGGPFVYWHDLPAACRKAAALGFDAVEVFPPSAEALASANLGKLLPDHGLKLAAVGTGAGWLRGRLYLTNRLEPVRIAQAVQFIRGLIDAAGPLGAPVIIGSMQGRADGPVTRDDALASLSDALGHLGEHSKKYGVPLLYEPLNRYETNLINAVADGVKLVAGLPNVKLLCDLFHMSIEEVDVAAALRQAGPAVGHVHLADSNRRAAGFGHTDFRPIAEALRVIGYKGYLSAEVLPLPDSDAAAVQTIAAVRKWFN